MQFPARRKEIHYGERIVDCFIDRPANIDAMFRAAVASFPDADALAAGEKRLTYRQLDGIVDAVAANLLDSGLRAGERVALLLGNGLEFVFCLLAAARAGLVCVPMNIRQRRPETAFVLNQCGAAALIYDAEHELQLPEGNEVPTLRHIYCVGQGAHPPFQALQKPAGKSAFADVPEEAVFCLLYTSGTTGQPKGAKLTHFSTLHSVLHYQHAFQLRAGDVAMLAVPASHVTGVVAIILTTIRVGGCTVMLPVFKARSFLEIAARQKVSYTLIVPAMYNLCLLDPDFSTFDLSHWRVAGFGGAPMPQATIEKLAQVLPNLMLVNIYGSTETTSPVTLLPLGDIKHAPTSVGKVLPCADLIIVDEQGREVAPGQSGEILIGGPMVVPGYWDNPAGDKSSFINGYWISGDIGSKDAEGYVYVFDRKKDMINRGGFKVYCIEVEGILARHPCVIETAVIGKPDPVLGERVHAFIVGRPASATEHDIKAFCAQHLSDYKVPDAVTFLDQPLPRNAAGKVLKTQLRALLQA